MTIAESKRSPGLVTLGTESLEGVWGFISLWAMIVLLTIIVTAGFIFYRLFATDNKVQSALDDPTATVSESIRYKISTQLPTSVDVEQPKVPVSAESETKPKTAVSEAIKNGTAPSGGNKDDEFAQNTQRDQSEPAISTDTKPQITESIKGPETLYMKIPVGRVRKAPSIDAEILFYLTKGDRVSVVDTRDGWYWIDTMDGRKGWAHGMLFSMDAPHSQMGADNLIRAVLVETPAPARKTVHIVLSDYHLPRTMVLEGERPRVVCDFYGLHLAPGMKKMIEYETGFVRGVRAGIHEGDNPKIRIVVDLVPEHDYIVEQRFILEENVYLLDIRYE